MTFKEMFLMVTKFKKKGLQESSWSDWEYKNYASYNKFLE